MSLAWTDPDRRALERESELVVEAIFGRREREAREAAERAEREAREEAERQSRVVRETAYARARAARTHG